MKKSSKRLNRLQRRMALLFSILMIAAIISGCSDNRPAPSQEAALPAGSNVASAPAPSASQATFQPGAGPILAHFSSGGVIDSLKQVDPSTGSVQTVFSVNQSALGNAKPTFEFQFYGRLSGWYKSQMFDPSLQRMAVNWEVSSDGSHHVGWLNHDGTLTDVTAKLTKGGSDFSAKPQDYNALFDPQGDFLYVDQTTGLLHKLDRETMAPVGDAIDVKNSYGNIPHLIMLQGDGSIDTYQYDRLIDGGMVFVLLMPSGIKINTSWRAPIEDIVDKDNVLVLEGGGLKVMGSGNLKTDPDMGGEYDPESGSDIAAITPATDYKFENAAVSGDGKQVAFVASRGQERDLFVMPITGGDPKKLVRLDDSSMAFKNTILLFWL